MSELHDRFVKRGFWVDQSKGATMGQTITTDTQTGTILVALLAVLSSLAITHLWNIITFTIHQIRANGRPADGLSRQQQALLRASPQPSSVVVDQIRLWWAWRRRANSAFSRTVFLSASALIFACASIATSVFSSNVIESSNIEVLVASPFCGSFNATGEHWTPIEYGYFKYMYPFADQLTQQCYLNNDTLPALCDTVPRPSIELQQSRVPCQFSGSMCPDNAPEAVAFDSGLVDMNKAFGLNLPSKERVQFRKRSSCSVLPTDGHMTVGNASIFPSLEPFYSADDRIRALHYGTIRDWTVDDWANATFFYSESRGNASEDYTIRSIPYHASPDMQTFNIFDPLPELLHEDADLTIILIGKNSVTYTSQVNDPLFAAHRSLVYRTYGMEGMSEYSSDDLISMLGCLEQYQFCVHQSNGDPICTDLTALPGRDIPKLAPHATDLQKAVLSHLMTVTSMFDISSVRSLRASSALRNGIGDGLPNDQWINEVVGWVSTTWAEFQLAIPDYAIGAKARDPLADSYIINPETPAQKGLCGMQKMPKSGGFVNINVFGLVFIVTFASVVIAIDLFLIKIMIHVKKFRQVVAPRIDRWIQDGVLQLQRRAHDAHGRGDWMYLDGEIPVTAEGEKMAELPLESLPKGISGTWRFGPEKSVTLVSMTTESDVSVKNEDRRLDEQARA
ncbi:hypothetical protein EJ04DRAFT_549815 [Polyplosphaeria fusca]|uniref:Uncharacterized protein n=1 Tax=Polyplosphaeria fusca TaxID=682080 RepID=A0A9P4R8E4_9PLEO|nr:hypothetical protein EJ04DRAFT_549815 [Polyplosphaeria fusca]